MTAALLSPSGSILESPSHISTSWSEGVTTSRSASGPSPSPSLSCPAAPKVVQNVTMELSSLLFPLDSLVSVAKVVSSSGAITVKIWAAQGVTFREAGNISGSVGGQWAVNKEVGGSTLVLQSNLAQSAVGHLSLVDPSPLTVAVDILAVGTCLPATGYRTRLVSAWTMQPLPPPTPLQAATQTTARASTVTSSVLGNPVMAITTVSMISLLSLSDCLFSDVDPLDASVSPTGAAVGPAVGQYYRGTAVVALVLYGSITVAALGGGMVLSAYRKGTFTDQLALLRFPSIGMVVIGLFGQGLASTGTSLLFLQNGGGDVLLGVASLVVCLGVVLWAVYATTYGLSCRKEQRSLNPSIHPVLTSFLRLATWRQHWRDGRGSKQYKRRHLLLIDDLERPWWTAVELSAALVQGVVLGVRSNAPATCRAQQWTVAAHCGLMLAAAVYFRPCGAILSNVFLIASKTGAFVMSLCILLRAVTLNPWFTAAADSVAAASTVVSSVQSAVQVVAAAVLLVPDLTSLTSRIQQKLLWRGEVDQEVDEEPKKRMTKPVLVKTDDPRTLYVKRINQEAAGAREVQVAMRSVMAAADPRLPRHEQLRLLIEAAARQGRR